MARLPTYDNFQITPQGGAVATAPKPDMSGFLRAGNVMQEGAQQVGEAADTATKMVLDMQDQANRVRVIEATNQARREALRLTYDETEGYQAVKGGDVMRRDGNPPLAVDYEQRLKQAFSKIDTSLGNDAQRMLFRQEAASIGTQFYGQARSYEAQEYRNYQLSTFAGQADIEAETIVRSGGDVDQIERSLQTIGSSVREIGRLKGLSENETTTAIGIAQSKAVTQSIAALLSGDDPITAGELYSRYKDKLVAEDRLRIEGPVRKETQSRAVLNAIDIAMGDVRSVDGATLPVQGGRISSKFGEERASGEHHNGVDIAVPIGTPVRAPAPGKVIAVFQDAENGKAVRIRHADGSISGYAHLSEQAVQVGDEVGAGQVFAKSGNTGHSTGAHLHYTLTRGGKKIDPLAKGSATARPITGEDLAARASAYLPEGLRDDPKVRDVLRSEAQQRWGLHRQAQNEQRDFVVESAQRWLIDNGGNFSAMPGGMRAAVVAAAPDKYDDLRDFGSAIQGGGKTTNDALFVNLLEDQTLKGLSNQEFYALRPQLSSEDFHYFGKRRRDLLDGKTDNSPGALNQTAINRVVDGRLTTMGIDPKPKSDARINRVAAVRRYINGQIANEQAHLGRQLTDVETDKFVDGLFLRTIRFKGGLFSGPTNEPLLSVTADQIPAPDRKMIEDGLTRRGIKPTDDTVLEAYLNWRSR